MTRRILWAVLVGGLFLACSDTPESSATVEDAETLLFRTELRGESAFDELSGGGKQVKYTFPTDGAPAVLDEACYFQNMTVHPWHLQFLQEFEGLEALDLDTYMNLVLYSSTRTLWGGSLVWWVNTPNPSTAQPGVYVFSLYSAPGDSAATADEVLQVATRLRSCAPLTEGRLAFVPTTPEQLAFRDELEAAGLETLLETDQVVSQGPTVHSEGEGYGYLKVVPEGEYLDDYGPLDVIIAPSAPNDISTVAGLLTATPQNPHSHVNLRLMEKAVPNASLPGVYDDSELLLLVGSLVHYTARDGEVALEPADAADAEAFWAQNRPVLPEPQSDLDEDRLGPFATIDATRATAYGTKAANLGSLHQILSPPHRTEGFAIPLKAYIDFVAYNGLSGDISDLLEDPALRGDMTGTRSRLKALRKAFRKGQIPPEWWSDIVAELEAVFGPEVHTRRIRFRSSSNAEDLWGFTGAGLYDSRSGCLADDLDDDDVGPSRCMHDDERAVIEAQIDAARAELDAYPERVWIQDVIDNLEGDLTEEKTVRRAITRVWGSLWNDRAYEEREFYGIDHSKVFMGVAVNPSFVLEQADAIAVTELRPDDGAPLYRVVSQLGNLGVAQPRDPTAVAEVMTFRRGAEGPNDVTLWVSSSESSGPIWTDGETQTLANLLFFVHDQFATTVYNHPDLHLDLELKRDRDGHIVIKQARPHQVKDP